MSDSSSNSSSPGKKLNVFEHNHHKETHGLREDIDVNTSISDVKAPNLFERAKEEIEALVEAMATVVHPSQTHDAEKRNSAANDHSKSEAHSEMAPKLVEKAKEEELKSPGHKPHHHHKETHGTSDDIDENTPISEVKGPTVFERAKEEIEALIQAFHPKKEGRNKD